MSFLLDSNPIIYYLNQQLSPEGKAFIDRILLDGVACSVITPLEVLGTRMPPDQRFHAESLLSLFRELPIDDSTNQQAIALRSVTRIKSIDALIAATALLHDLPLISRNRKDFAAIEGLSLIDPFQPPAQS
jgi:predicted nucleic acid-binding protein